MRQDTSACVSMRQHTSAYVGIRQHTSAYLSIRQHMSAEVSRSQQKSAVVQLVIRTGSHMQQHQGLTLLASLVQLKYKYYLLYWYKSKLRKLLALLVQSTNTGDAAAHLTFLSIESIYSCFSASGFVSSNRMMVSPPNPSAFAKRACVCLCVRGLKLLGY